MILEPESVFRLTFSLTLPLLLMFLLIMIRLLDPSKHYKPPVSPRDAALIALALDFSELAPSLYGRMLEGRFYARMLDGRFYDLMLGGRPKSALVVVSALLLLHTSALVLAAYWESRDQAAKRPSEWQVLAGMYIALMLLFTNAVTILQIITRLGRLG